jgi:hypothetical protein
MLELQQRGYQTEEQTQEAMQRLHDEIRKPSDLHFRS